MSLALAEVFKVSVASDAALVVSVRPGVLVGLAMALAALATLFKAPAFMAFVLSCPA